MKLVNQILNIIANCENLLRKSLLALPEIKKREFILSNVLQYFRCKSNINFRNAKQVSTKRKIRLFEEISVGRVLLKQ